MAESNVDPVAGFTELFVAAGGEVERVPDTAVAADWLSRFAADFTGISVGSTVPTGLRPPLPRMQAQDAPLALSRAVAAVAQSGSLLLDARDGRRTQLLAPTHVILVEVGDVFSTLASALTRLRPDLPSAVGLHSGPSKSADIGQILVRGVHGPGRVVAVLIG